LKLTFYSYLDNNYIFSNKQNSILIDCSSPYRFCLGIELDENASVLLQNVDATLIDAMNLLGLV